jgi:hypothetical protein
MTVRRMTSTSPKNKDRMNTETMTTAVEPMTCFFGGQLTFPISVRTSFRNRVVFLIQSRTDFPPGVTVHDSWFRAEPKLPSSER